MSELPPTYATMPAYAYGAAPTMAYSAPQQAGPYPCPASQVGYQGVAARAVASPCEYETRRQPYDLTAAMILCFAPALVFCIHGCHRCYLGDVCIGTCQCLTLGGCGIWSLIDFFSLPQMVELANRRSGVGASGYCVVQTNDCASNSRHSVYQVPQVAYQNPTGYSGAYYQQPQCAQVYQ